MARQYGASEEVLERLDDLEHCPVDPASKAALRFAETMTRDASSIDEDSIQALRAYYDEPQVVEIACVVGLFNYLNRFAEAMGLWPTREGEGGPAAES